MSDVTYWYCTDSQAMDVAITREPNRDEYVDAADYDALRAERNALRAMLHSGMRSMSPHMDSTFEYSVHLRLGRARSADDAIDAAIASDSAPGHESGQSGPMSPDSASELRRMAAGSGFMADCARAVLNRDTNAAERDRRALLAHVDHLTALLAATERDAALGRIAMRFVDRAGDTCPEDPAERICEQFYSAMSDEVDRQLGLRRIEEAGRE